MTHGEAFELLPWLVNSSLSPRERDAVEQHLAGCPVCQQEMDQQQGLQNLVRETSVIPLPTSRSFNRLLSRIDASDSDSNETQHNGWRWPYLAAAAVAGASLTALLIIAIMDNSAPPEEFITLTESGSLDAAGPTLHVVFASGSSEADMRAVLLGVESEIVSGPTPEGIYTVRITGNSGEVDAVLDRLRSDSRVRIVVRNYQNTSE